ncbi:NAD(P)H-binding protein [Leifsonia poae]|uniref:NAD(P)H-binding protein n=1 Tax=Leifsonia poae TaxID=110933 RepID=UPI001CBBD7A9|nr:NAD(P)H-binding protein [Leifsonia poae]
MRPRTVLAIGATGSVGVPVVAEALRQGYRVRALIQDSGRAGRRALGAESVVGDLPRSGTLVAAVDGVDAVVFTHGSHGGPGQAPAMR